MEISTSNSHDYTLLFYSFYYSRVLTSVHPFFFCPFLLFFFFKNQYYITTTSLLRVYMSNSNNPPHKVESNWDRTSHCILHYFCSKPQNSNYHHQSQMKPPSNYNAPFNVLFTILIYHIRNCGAIHIFGLDHVNK